MMRRANFVDRDPRVEAIEAARSNLRPDEAVQRVFWLQRQYRSLGSNRVPPSPVDPYEIIRTLTQKRIPFVLTGAHGIASWTGKPRSTQDVDVLVKAGRNHARAVKAITELYPQLEVRKLTGIAAFFLVGETDSVIDVVYPHRADIEETLENAVWAEDRELGLRYRVPRLEEALANKYGAMLTPNRALDKRMQDTVDFMRMAQHSTDPGRKAINLVRLQALGEKVWPGGGAEELKRLVAQVLAGTPIEISSLVKRAP
jgi:hypothetical protein